LLTEISQRDAALRGGRFFEFPGGKAKRVAGRGTVLTPFVNHRPVRLRARADESPTAYGTLSGRKDHLQLQRRLVVGCVDADEPLAGREDRVDLRPLGHEHQTVARRAVVRDVDRTGLARFRMWQPHTQKPRRLLEWKRCAVFTDRVDREIAAIELDAVASGGGKYLQLDPNCSGDGLRGDVGLDGGGIAKHVEAARVRLRAAGARTGENDDDNQRGGEARASTGRDDHRRIRIIWLPPR
jgi:hypothetical protein